MSARFELAARAGVKRSAWLIGRGRERSRGVTMGQAGLSPGIISPIRQPGRDQAGSVTPHWNCKR